MRRIKEGQKRGLQSELQGKSQEKLQSEPQGRLQRKLQNKLQSSGGETLIEVLASALIGSLSVALLMSLIITSVRIGESAEDSDESFYEHLIQAEEQTSPAEDEYGAERTAEITIQEIDPATGAPKSPETEVTVDIYGGDGVISFKAKTSGGGGGP